MVSLCHFICTDRLYSSAITCRVRRFDPYTSCLSPVYHSSGHSFSASTPFSGSSRSHCSMASRHTLLPGRRLRFGMIMPGIGDCWVLLISVVSVLKCLDTYHYL